MATLATADLPSDDEEDDDYVPVADNDAEISWKNSKRKVLDGVEQARASKQAKRVSAVWDQLKRDTATATSCSTAAGAYSLHTAEASPPTESSAHKTMPRQRVTAYQLCRRVQKKPAQDRSWRRHFGMPVSPLQQMKAVSPADSNSQQLEASKAIAAAAIAAAKALATTDQYGRVIITETRKFAGQNIQMKKAGVGSSESETKAAVSGLDAMLAAIKGAKKVTVLDKSKADWSVHKQEAQLESDLAGHNRSNDRYVDKQDFLARAEVREYEASRDSRLNADVRNRSRA